MLLTEANSAMNTFEALRKINGAMNTFERCNFKISASCALTGSANYNIFCLIKVSQHISIIKHISILMFERASTSFPGLSCEDEGREEKALVFDDHVIWAYLAATRQEVASHS
jgi:hypothetical protein